MLIGSRNDLSIGLWFTENREIISVLSCTVLLLIKKNFKVLYCPLWEIQQLQEQWYPFLPLQCFCVSKQWCGSQCLGLLTCAQMLMHALALWGCMDSVREKTLKVDWEKNPLPARDTNLHQYCAFQWDAQPTELSQCLYHQVTSTVYLMQMPINIFGEILQVATACKCFSYAVGYVTLVDLWSVGKGRC